VLLALRKWFDTASANNIRESETELLATILPNLFGYHIVQLGMHVSTSIIESSRISHAITICDGFDEGSSAGMIGRWDALPLAPNAIDVLVAPHVLEFCPEPHAVLREAERVLIGEGYIVITGFNPWSLCGIWRLLGGWRGRPPWCGRFISISRIADWLQLLGFEIEFSRKISFRPPLRRAGVARKLKFLELIGRAIWPYFGNVYVVVAKKHVAAVTPLKASWQTRRRMLASGVAEPTARLGDDTPMQGRTPRER
jgi:SAM-dependent methyltransferase